MRDARQRNRKSRLGRPALGAVVILAALVALASAPAAAQAHGPIAPIASNYLAKVAQAPAGFVICGLVAWALWRLLELARGRAARLSVLNLGTGIGLLPLAFGMAARADETSRGSAVDDDLDEEDDGAWGLA